MMLLDIILHLDVHLVEWITALGPWIHVLLFAIVFCETGLVIMPFLPGDSLIFTLGAVAAAESSSLNLPLAFTVLSLAAIIGNSVNYAIGRRMGPRVFRVERRWLSRKHLMEAQRFYERHGGKTIVITRFLPIIRTFAPFVAGVGRMAFARFTAFNVAGGVLWVAACLLAGHFFGNIPFIKRHFDVVVVVIIVVSMVPFLLRMLSGKFKSRRRHETVSERIGR